MTSPSKLGQWLVSQLANLATDSRRTGSREEQEEYERAVREAGSPRRPSTPHTPGPELQTKGRMAYQREGQNQLPNRGVIPSQSRTPSGDFEPGINDLRAKQPLGPDNPHRPNLVEDPSAGMDPMANPFSDILGGVSESYDQMIAAIAGLGPIYKDQAREAQGRVGGFFDYAKDTAEAGRAPIRETYETASQNVGGIYDELAGQLAAAPQRSTDLAAAAGGRANATAVADRVAAATAPFQAAGESGRANALANLTQHSAAGQDYLTQLASAAPAEGAMHQSAIEGALNQQLQGIAFKQAELEGAKQRALAEVSADIAGDASERMANAAMAQALGLDIPEGIDVGDFLTNRNRMADFQGKGLTQQQAMLNLAQDQDPLFQLGQVKSQLRPSAQSALESVMQGAEASYDPMEDSPEEFGFKLIENLEAAIEDPNSPEWFNSPDIVNEVRTAIRSLTGPYG